MPRKPIEITEKIEYLSILDENANVDTKLEPKLDNDTLKKMYRFMLLGRRTDERMLKMQRTGRLGTFPQASGHEAVSIGSVSAIEKSDWHIPAYRELAGMLYRGWSLEKIILYWNGYEEGAVPPKGVNDLPYCVPVASQLLHAAGVGMAMNIKGDKKVALTYFGDGSSSEGDFHEALNFASVFKAPVIFVCQNNQYAISVPLSKQMNCKTLAQRAVAYGMPGIKVDGNDVLAMYVATKEAVDRAKAGGGPTLIEGLTYRFTPHTTADDPKRYRSEEESKEWFGKEPLTRFAKYLQNKGVMTAKDLEEMEAEVDAEIRAGIERSETLSKSEELMNPLAMFDHLYSTETEHLKEQKEELRQYLEHKKKGKKQQNHTAHPEVSSAK
ncbi:pyruvate dehydrogenase (acetyl-transferring) E1 component subunit alpha [bacterium]|nr:pyruvate dehydrogenase (acetyl-transferring) E1 component subunit alpha [bacterium]QQR59400.1 MAG: pyruvate dehydrogenase (acetyl-transferring) E1 component subunit alpha [Candidatus Melainabacteria bacterium]